MNVGDLDGFVRGLWLMVAGGAALGVVTMIAVQLLKDLMPLQRWCQKHWMNGQVEQLLQKSRPRLTSDGREALAPTADEVKKHRDDLSALAAAGHDRALFDLPTDRLAGQLNTAAQAVLDFPDQHKDLLELLAAGAAEEDLNKLKSPPPRAPTLASAPFKPLAEQEQAQLTKFVDARNRVAFQVQRNLDAAQIGMALRWKFWVQVWSLALSLGFALVAAWVVSPAEARQTVGWWLTTIALGLLGGVLASVARDLAAVLYRLRRGL